MKRAILMGFAMTVVAAANADIITQWNFNSVPPDGNTGTGTLTPNVGMGTASLVGGTTGSFASGAVNGGSTDPATEDNSGWQTTTYAAQGAESGLRGVQFNVSTVGFMNLVVSWDHRHSNTSSRYFQFQYALDGMTFSSAGLAGDGVFMGDAGDTWFNNRSVNLAGIGGVADNADFAFRIVAIFEPGTSMYTASKTGSDYAGGTARFDMVTVRGAEVPEPATMAVLGLGAAALIRRRRSAK